MLSISSCTKQKLFAAKRIDNKHLEQVYDKGVYKQKDEYHYCIKLTLIYRMKVRLLKTGLTV
jgi:hypothetical protein